MKAESASKGSLTAEFVATAGTRTFPPEVIDAAKMCLVDWMGVALGAHAEGAAVSTRRMAEAWGAGGNAQILLGPKTTPALAALVNGTMSHCMDYDDAHTQGGGHVSAPNWAAALAMASHLGADEQRTLMGFITGFEVMARLGGGGAAGMGRNLQLRGIHPTSVWGRFGAAAVACAMLGLDAERTAHAMGVAATTAAGLNASFGTMSKPFHAGKAAMDGILAAQLAAEGFEAATNLLDADNGLQGTFIQDRQGAIPPLEFSAGWELLRNAFKPYACCRATHPSVDAARSLAAQVGDAEVVEVQSVVHKGALVPAGQMNPQTPLQGKFSMPYCIALGLRGYDAVFTDFSPERLADRRIMDIVPRVTCTEDPDLERFQARLAVILADGKRLEAETKVVLGHPDNPMTWDDMHTKFAGLVEPVLGADDSEALWDTMRDFEQPGALAKVLALVQPRPAN